MTSAVADDESARRRAWSARAKKLGYRWFDPRAGIFDLSTIEVHVIYDPEVHTDSRRLRWELQHAFAQVLQSLEQEVAAHEHDRAADQER